MAYGRGLSRVKEGSLGKRQVLPSENPKGCHGVRVIRVRTSAKTLIGTEGPFTLRKCCPAAMEAMIVLGPLILLSRQVMTWW